MDCRLPDASGVRRRQLQGFQVVGGKGALRRFGLHVCAAVKRSRWDTAFVVSPSVENSHAGPDHTLPVLDHAIDVDCL